MEGLAALAVVCFCRAVMGGHFYSPDGLLMGRPGLSLSLAYTPDLLLASLFLLLSANLVFRTRTAPSPKGAGRRA